MQTVVPEIIDGDGHIFEKDELLHQYLRALGKPEYQLDTLRNFPFFPAMDGWMRSVFRARQGRPLEAPTAEDWSNFLDESGIRGSVLYPSAGLAFGYIKDTTWATDLARAYNDHLYDLYLRREPRLKGMAIIPVQDPGVAAQELRRVVRDLGMVGAVLPATGLRRPYGSTWFDPIYEEAQSLGALLTVHGAPQQGLALDFFEDFRESRVLEHPLAQMIQFTSMIWQRVFQRFPRLKVAYMEAGCGWVPYYIERIDREVGENVASRQVAESPVYFHAELPEKAIPHVVSVVGADRLLYASDFPHEPKWEVEETLHEFLGREDLNDDVKRKILCDNIKAAYGLG